MIEFFYFLVGAAISWIVSWAFYKKASDESKKEFDKLHEELFERAIKKIKKQFGDKEKVSIILGDLWRDILRKHGQNFFEGRCPKCGSDNIQTISIPVSDYDDVETYVCQNCGYELD